MDFFFNPTVFVPEVCPGPRRPKKKLNPAQSKIKSGGKPGPLTLEARRPSVLSEPLYPPQALGGSSNEKYYSTLIIMTHFRVLKHGSSVGVKVYCFSDKHFC